jgi:hypothetical protein
MASHNFEWFREASMSASGSISIRKRGRRDFLKVGGAVTAALLAPAALKADAPNTLPAPPSNPRTPAAMSLPQQRLCAGIDFSHAILINLPSNGDLLIQYYFQQTIHQNLLALSLLGDTGSFTHYLLAQWRDTTQAYTLSNNTGKRQIWYLSGWECCQFTNTLDCPNAQLHLGADPADPSNTNKRWFLVACQIPGPLHRGDMVSKVTLTNLNATK